jgi:hypothetical protein
MTIRKTIQRLKPIGVKNNYRDFFAAAKQNHVKDLTWFFVWAGNSKEMAKTSCIGWSLMAISCLVK